MNFQETTKKRLSILKTPKAQNEEEKKRVQSPSFRSAGNRVSFSSNYIKCFTTDEEKNTIWDTTIEEAISNTESTQSTESSRNTNYQSLDMSMTQNSFYDVSSDMELTNCVLASQNNLIEEKENIAVYQEEVHEVYVASVEEKLQKCQVIPSEKENIPPVRQKPFSIKKVIENINIISIQSMTQSCHVAEKMSGSKCEQGESEDMEMSCMNLNGNTSEVMEFTCNNPILPSYPDANAVNVKDVSIPNFTHDMEFTCMNPVIRSDPTRNKIEKNATLDSPDDIEFTCQNPLPVSNLHEDMEFTCKNLPTMSDPVENKTVSKTNIIPNSPIDMEFTYRNPIPIFTPVDYKAIPTSHSIPDPSVDMEFTCRNPIPTSNLQDDMEFTCKNLPGISDTPVNVESIRLETKIDTPTDMEFTCRNPLPIFNTSSQEDLELTCKIPSISDEAVLNAGPITNTSVYMGSMRLDTPRINDPVETTINNEEKFKILSDSVGNIPSSLRIHDQVDLETTTGTLALKHSDYSSTLERFKENITLTSIANDDHQHALKNPVVAAGITIDQSINDDSNATAYLLRCSTLNKTYEINNTTSLLHELSLPQCELPKLPIESISNVQEVELPILLTPNETNDEDVLEQVSTSKLVDESCYSVSKKLTDTIIDDEISPELVNSFNDVSSVNLMSDLKEDIPERNSSTNMIQTHEPLDHAKYLAEIQKEEEEEMRALEEVAKYKQELKQAFKRVDDLLVRGKKSKNEYAEKFAKFMEYRNNLLQEAIADRDCSKSLENTQSSNRDSSINFEDIENILPSLVTRIKEKADLPECKWKITKIEDNVGHFTTLLGKFEIRLEYEPSEIVSKVDTQSLLTYTSRPIAFLLEKEFLRTITGDKLSNSIGHRYTIITFLDYIQLVMQNIIEYYLDLKDLQMSYQLELTYDYRASFIILDTDLITKWIFKIDLTNLDNITRDCVIVEALIGPIDKEKVFSFIPECTKGVQFIRSFVNKIEEYKECIKKRHRLIFSKKGVNK